MGPLSGLTSRGSDSKKALTHANGRVYDPMLGRFLSVDPVFAFPTNTQSLNPYSYVLNNPLSNTDPTGYNTVCIEDMGCVGGEGNRDDKGNLIKTNANSQSNGSNNKQTTAGAQQKDPSKAGEGEGTPGQISKQIGSDAKKEDDNNSPSSNGYKLTPEQEKAFKSQHFNQVQGIESGKETRYEWNGTGQIHNRTQSGCSGDDDCVFYKKDLRPDTTALGHTHIRAPSTTRDAAERLSREIPGPGDANPLQEKMPSTVLTEKDAHYVVEGTFAHPYVRYLGGGDSALGDFVQKNWHPDTGKDIEYNNSYIKQLAQQYLNSQNGHQP